MDSPGDTGKETVTLRLSPRQATLLRLLAELQECSLDEAAERAISTEALIFRARKRKSQILIKRTDGTAFTLEFR